MLDIEPDYPGQTATAPRKTAIAIVYWGRLGAGAALMAQLCEAMARDRRFEVYASPSKQSEIQPPLPENRTIPVSTFAGPVSLVLRTLLLPLIVRRVVRTMIAAEVKAIVTIMPHLWGLPLRRAARRAGIRTILTLHDADPHPGEKRPVFDRLVRAEASASDRIVTLSNHVADRLIARGDSTPDRLIRLYHPVFRFGAAAPSDRSSGQPVRLLFFGRVLPYKGVPMLLAAFAKLRESGVDYVLRVVGRGLSFAPDNLTRQEGLILEEGWLAPDAVGGVLESADLVVLPYHEASQSGVVAAAYGAGLPVVVTPVGGLIEQVIDGHTGVIARGVTADALAAAVRRLMETPGLYATCRLGVAQFAEAHSFDRFAAALGDAAWDLIAEPRPP